MKIDHHPRDETLMRYAAGTLGAGPSIVVGAHLANCPECRDRVAAFEAIGGELIETVEPTQLSDDSLARALARLDLANDRAPRRSAEPIMIDGIRLPDTLRGCSVGKWRWVAPGMHMSRITVPNDRYAKVMLLKVAPGKGLPDHGHKGSEFTYIVQGSYTDKFGQYRPGDLTEMDADIEHQPIVDEGEDCICLAALEGSMRFNSMIGRMVQPFVGI
jgi:putative transcriptional regulator